MDDKFRVRVLDSEFDSESPTYFRNFWGACMDAADKNNWLTSTVANYELKPLGGRLIQTKTQGLYLRWDKESSHTAFVLKWS